MVLGLGLGGPCSLGSEKPTGGGIGTSSEDLLAHTFYSSSMAEFVSVLQLAPTPARIR